jgi:cysteine sulfinate desulfinase/cysteine desulfurase-like protein
MGLSKQERNGAFRVSFSPDSTEEEAEQLVNALVRAERELLPAL